VNECNIKGSEIVLSVRIQERNQRRGLQITFPKSGPMISRFVQQNGMNIPAVLSVTESI
jgi:hypothetical protein